MHARISSSRRFSFAWANAWRRLVAALRHRARAAAQPPCPDASALRDLGLDASEWSSVQAELAGRAAATRRRVVLVA
jgi:hypothetical protein